jgi:hypothetical protein
VTMDLKVDALCSAHRSVFARVHGHCASLVVVDM